MSNEISVETAESTAIIRFTRPEVRNPLSVGVLIEIDELMDEFSADVRFEKIVFTGTADAFASGADLREIALITSSTAEEFSLRGQQLMNKIAACGKSTVAVINGFCYGGALDLAVACGRRVASPTATFCHPGAGLGIITGWGGTQRIPRLIGRANVLELFYTASPISARRALEIRLIDAIADVDAAI